MAKELAKKVINDAIKVVEEYEKKAFEVPMEEKAVVLDTYITEIREKMYWIKTELENADNVQD